MKKIQKSIAKLMILLFVSVSLNTNVWAVERGPKGDSSPLNESGSKSKRASLSVAYLLAPGDGLQIDIRNHSGMNTQQYITPDGTISLPMVGRLKVQGLTLAELDALLKAEYTKYIQAPMIVTYLVHKTTRPIFVMQRNLANNTWQVHKAETIEEARALAGPNFSPTANIEEGSVIQVETGQKPDWFQQNWYRVITATILVTGFVVSRK